MSKSLMADELNQHIVRILQAEGRVSHAELAERLDISRPTLIERIKRLEAEGILDGYMARVSPASVNKPNVAWVAVRHRSGDHEALVTKYLDALKDEPDILECYSIAGEDGLLLKVVGESPIAIHEQLKRIRNLGLQVTTRTTIVLQTHFVKPGPSPMPTHSMREAPVGRQALWR